MSNFRLISVLVHTHVEKIRAVRLVHRTEMDVPSATAAPIVQ